MAQPGAKDRLLYNPCLAHGIDALPGSFLLFALSDKTPIWEEVGEMYDVTNERIRVQNY